MSAVAMPCLGARRRLRDHRYRSHYAPAQTLAERKPRSANNRFLVEGSKRDECLTTEQVPEVIGVRLMLGVGGYVSNSRPKDQRAALMDLTWSGPSLHVRMMPLSHLNFVLGRLPCCVTSLLLRNIVAAP